MRGAWSTYGFWLAVGLSAGMLISDLTDPPTAEAATAMRHEEYCMVTGASFDPNIDLIWLLDYKYALLHCITMDRQGGLQGMSPVDLVEQLQIEEGQRIKPHFMMVTGRFTARATTDNLYLAEIETGQILCVEPPLVQGARQGQPLIPQVVSRFRFRPQGD